jgi:hypothetical protein
MLALTAALTLIGFGAATVPAGAATPQVLRVGSWHGIAGTYTSVQQAVRAAHAGDWVLVGPGDYKENGYAGAPEPAGVLITTAGLHLRGMNRNSVVIDGTKPGSATCSSKKSDQIFAKDGRDGVQVLKVDGTYIDNLTACNYLTGTGGGEEGNEIWWNGGDGSGKIGMGTFWGNYLTATSTYSNGVDSPRGEYGIFTSNAKGPASINHTYASNMGDAAYYIGACTDCNQVLDDAHGEFSALGYSGTNSGGNLTIENSEFDQNKSGIVSNSQNNDDQPSPQVGACPSGKGPLGLGICTLWKNNNIHDNNNPNVPGAGSGSLAGSGPVGAGIVLAGSRDIAVVHNRIVHNGSWGVLVTDLPDQESPPAGFTSCRGGIGPTPPAPGQDPVCYYEAYGNAVESNSFTDNGFFGNPSNGDIGFLTLAHNPGNCAAKNTNTDGPVKAFPPLITTTPSVYACTDPIGPNAGDVTVQTLEALCDTELLFQCPTVANPPVINYPRTTGVSLHMPPAQPTMPDPCAGVPVNPWCPAAASKPRTLLATTGLHVVLPFAALTLLAAAAVIRARRPRAGER